MKKIFIAGSVHSNLDNEIIPQHYRDEIRDWITLHGCEALDAMPDGGWNLDGVDDTAVQQQVDLMLSMVRESHLVLANISTASMGTAIEIFEAFHCEIPVIIISDMDRWVLRAFSTIQFHTFVDLKNCVQLSGGLSVYIDTLKKKMIRRPKNF